MERELVSISHWGMFEKPLPPLMPRPFKRVFPYPSIENKKEYLSYFLNIKV